LIISYTFVYVRQLIETLELSTLFFSYQQQLSAKNLVFCTQEGDWRQIFLQTKDKLFSTHHRTAPSFTLQGWSTESWNRLVTLGHTHSCPFTTQTFRNEIGDGGKFFRLTRTMKKEDCFSYLMSSSDFLSTRTRPNFFEWL
jgi:hypothetical protein